MSDTPEDPRIQAVLDSMCEGKSYRKAIKAAGISDRQFRRVLDADESLRGRYAHARARLLEHWAEDVVDIIDDDDDDDVVKVARAKARVDSRKWLLARLNPKQYGERVAVDNTHRIEMTPEQMDARIAELQRALALSDAAGTARIARREGAAQEPEQDQ